MPSELDCRLTFCRQNTAPTTFAKYNSIAAAFRAFLKATEKAPMLVDVTTSDVGRFLMHKRETTAAITANVTRKILSAMFKRAIAENRLRDNSVLGVARFKAQTGERVKKRIRP